jgi:hypothetical protein
VFSMHSLMVVEVGEHCASVVQAIVHHSPLHVSPFKH